MNETNSATPIDLESRPTYREMGEILIICGMKFQDFGVSIDVHHSYISRLVRQKPLDKMKLTQVDGLKKFVGEENYYKALTEIRREAQKK